MTYLQKQELGCFVLEESHTSSGAQSKGRTYSTSKRHEQHHWFSLEDSSYDYLVVRIDLLSCSSINTQEKCILRICPNIVIHKIRNTLSNRRTYTKTTATSRTAKHGPWRCQYTFYCYSIVPMFFLPQNSPSR
jgi:hypothetical protein